MEAKKLTVNQVKNLVNSVKAIYRLNGFVTGKRTNLQKAAKECRFDYAELGKGIDTSLSFPESVFEKEYQIDAKARFSNNSDWYEIWFEDSKCYLFELYETGQTDKTEMDIFEMFYSFLSDCRIVIDCYSFEDFQAEFEGTKEGYNACKRALQKFERVFCSSGIDLYDLSNYLQEKYNF